MCMPINATECHYGILLAKHHHGVLPGELQAWKLTADKVFCTSAQHLHKVSHCNLFSYATDQHTA